MTTMSDHDRDDEDRRCSWCGARLSPGDSDICIDCEEQSLED
jgi:hypothetical protein